MRIRDVYYARIRWTIDSKQNNKLISLGTKQKAKANRLFQQIQDREKLFRQGTIPIEKLCIEDIPPIDNLIDEFKEYLKVNNKSKKTQELYNLALNTFKNIFDGKDITVIGKSDYNYFMQEMKSVYSNPVTLNIRLRSIRAFLRWAVEFDKIERLPFTIKQIKVDSKMPRYFSNAEIKTIFDAINDEEVLSPKLKDILFARVKLHLNTGMRLREINNSYLDNGFIHVYKSKGGQERQIPVDSETAYYYEFSKKQTLTDNHISRLFKDVLEHEKVMLYRLPDGDKRSFHCLRHTFAVKTYYKARDIYYVCKLLGHHSVVMTEIYAKFNLEKLEKDFGETNKTLSNLKQKTANTDANSETTGQYAVAN